MADVSRKADIFRKLEEPLDRREFTLKSALALLSGVAITIVGCGDSSSPASPSAAPSPPPTSNPTGNATGTGDVMGSVSANHGHVATITAAQLTAGGVLLLDITGGANHPHTVELSADEVSRIGGGQRVTKTSSTNSAHNHMVTFN